MAKRVTTGVLRDSRAEDCPADVALQDGLVQVMAPMFAGLDVLVHSRRREYPLPGPVPPRVRILASQTVGQGHPAGTPLEVSLVQRTRLLEMLPDPLTHRLRE